MKRGFPNKRWTVLLPGSMKEIHLYEWVLTMRLEESTGPEWARRMVSKIANLLSLRGLFFSGKICHLCTRQCVMLIGSCEAILKGLSSLSPALRGTSYAGLRPT
jgi:hypothetical protein